MAGRDTLPAPDAGGGRDIFSSLPDYVIIMEILPKLGAPDSQGKELVRLAGTNARRRGVVQDFLARAPDSYLAGLSHRSIEILQIIDAERVRARLQKYTQRFPTRYRGLFAGFRLDPDILREMLKQADLLKHRYYRDLVRPLVSMTPARMVRAVTGPTAFFTPDLLRLMRLAGVALDGLLWAAVDGNNAYIARLAIEVLDQPCTDEMVREAIRNDYHRTRPGIYRLLAGHAQGLVRDGMLRVAAWRGQPGHDAHVEEIHRMLEFYMTVREAEPDAQTELQILQRRYDAYVRELGN